MRSLPLSLRYYGPVGKVSQQMLLLNYYRETSKGWLKKEGHFMRTIKKRFFVLHEGTLRYYEKDFSEPPYGTGLKGEVKVMSIPYF